MRKLALALVIAGALAPQAQAAEPTLCRDAKAGAVRYAAHMVKYMELDNAARYHDCGRLHKNRRHLWFRFTARDEELGPMSWWVRATWHGTRWHYFNRGVNVDFGQMPNVELQVEG